MVKGVSPTGREVPPDPKWFEQAIFSAREEAGAEDAPEERRNGPRKWPPIFFAPPANGGGSGFQRPRPGGRRGRLGDLAFATGVFLFPFNSSGGILRLSPKQKGRERHAQRHSHRHARCGQEHHWGCCWPNPGHDLS